MTSPGSGTWFTVFIDWDIIVGTDFICAALIAAAKVAVSGNTSAKLAIQTAAVRIDEPDDWQVIDDVLVVNNDVDAEGNLDVTAYTAGKMWARWGVAFYMSSTGAGSADVTLFLATVSKGMLAGSWRGHLVSLDDVDTVQPVTGFLPAAFVQAVYAAIINTSSDAAFQGQLYYRTAEASQTASSAATGVISAWTLFTNTSGSGDDDRLVIKSTLSFGTNMWVQIGYGYQSTSGTSSSDVAVTVAVRRT